MAAVRTKTWVKDQERWLAFLDSPSDTRKFRYAVEQFEGQDPWDGDEPLEEECEAAVAWLAQHDACTINQKRETIVARLEEADKRQRESGAVDHWFDAADREIQRVSKGANGFLFEQLLTSLEYHDVACVELLREGSLVSLVN